jgi:hypothetical protein
MGDGPNRSVVLQQVLHLAVEPHPVSRQSGLHPDHVAPAPLLGFRDKAQGQLPGQEPPLQALGVAEVVLSPL